MKDLWPHLLGMLVGVIAAVGIIYLMLNLGKVDTPPAAFADPVAKAQIEAKVSNLGLPDPNVPYGRTATDLMEERPPVSSSGIRAKTSGARSSASVRPCARSAANPIAIPQS